MVDTNTRQAKRAPVTLKIKFKSETLEQFIERYSVDISHGGIFIRTKDPLAVGTALRFEFQLKDATPLITGEGTVVWTREHDPSRAGVAPGMGVRFDRLPSDSQRVLDRILAEKAQRTPRTDTNAFVETPTRVAPSPLVAGLARDSGRPDRTLVGIAPATGRNREDSRPPPLSPFDEDVSEEAFEENTKVASLHALAARTARTLDDDGEEEEPTRRVTREQMDVVKAQGGFTSPSPPAIAPTEPRLRPVVKTPPDTIVDDLAPERAAQAERNAHLDDDEQITPPPRLLRQGQDRGQERGKKTSSSPPPEAADSRMRTEVSPHASSMPSDAPVARAADLVAESKSSSTPWIAAAAVLLILGGVAGWWYMSGRGGTTTAANDTNTAASVDETAKTAAAETEPSPEKAETNVAATEPAAKAVEAGVNPVDPVPVPPKGTLEATVDSKPPGAIAELVDTDQRGPTPMKFTGLEDRPYKVRVTAEGHVPKETDLVPGATAPLAVVLDPMARLLRVSSTPAGAEVYVNGRRKGVTPVDVELSGPLAKLKQYNIALSMRGYERFTNRLNVVDTTFATEGERLVAGLDAKLKQRVVAARPRPKPPDEPEVQPDPVEPPDDPQATPPDDPGTTPDKPPTKPDEKPPATKPDPAGKAADPGKEKPKDSAKPKEPARDPITGKPEAARGKPKSDEPVPEFAE